MAQLDDNKSLSISKQRKLTSIAGQIGLLFAFAAQFCLFARLSPWRADWELSFVSSLTLKLFLFGIIAVALLAYWVYSAHKIKLYKFDKESCILVAALVIFHFIVRVSMLGYATYADGAIYYPQIHEFAKTINTPLSYWLSNHKLGTHISYGYNFWVFMWEYIMPGRCLGYQWVHLLLGCATVPCIYGILNRVVPKRNKITVALATLLVSLQPSVFGMFTSCNLDFPMALFFIFAIYCLISKRYILSLFWIISLGTTKENGIMMAFLIIGVAILIWLVEKAQKKGLKAIFNKNNTGKLIAAGIGIVLLIIAFIYIINVPLWGGAKIVDIINFGEDTSVDMFGQETVHSSRMTFVYKADHFWKKVAQMYVLNFSWIMVLILVISIAYIAYTKYAGKSRLQSEASDNQANAVNKNLEPKKKVPFKWSYFTVILVPYVIHVLFLLFYQEAKQPRYNMISDYIFFLICAIVILRAFGRKVWTPVVLAFLSILMFIESFATIDPLSKAVFTKVDTNREPLLFTWGYASEIPYIVSGIGDTCFYNYQATYAERAIDEAINKLIKGTDEEMTAIYMISVSFESVEEQFTHEDFMWDTKINKRQMILEPVEGRDIPVIRYNAWELAIKAERPQKAILYELVSDSNFLPQAIGVLQEDYEFDGPYTTNQGLGGSMTYYIMTKKEKTAVINPFDMQ